MLLPYDCHPGQHGDLDVARRRSAPKTGDSRPTSPRASSARGVQCRTAAPASARPRWRAAAMHPPAVAPARWLRERRPASAIRSANGDCPRVNGTANEVRRDHHRHGPGRTDSREETVERRHVGRRHRAPSVRRDVRQHRVHSDQSDGGQRVRRSSGASCPRLRRDHRR